MTTAEPRPTVVLQEWQRVERPDLHLAETDRDLATDLAAGEGRLVIDELRAGLRLRATSWVGLVRFQQFDVCVAPKLAGENIGLVHLLEFTTGLRALKRLAGLRTLPIAVTLDLFDLIALLFVEECAAVVRAGLLADYVVREDAILALRGRLLPDRQFTRQFGRIDLLECRYDEHETDIPENQVLAAALRVCADRVRDDGVRLRAKRLGAILDEVCDPAGADLRLIRQTLVYDRLNEDYRAAHALAWFVLDALGVRDLLSAGDAGSFAFLIDMNALFEQFIERVLDRLCAGRGLRVYAQRKDRSILWHETTNRSYAGVIPDLLVQRPDGQGGLLAIDAKYKPYDARKLSNEDIYQTFLYAFAYGADPNSLPQALIVYPASQPTPIEDILQVRDRHGQPLGRIHALGMHVPTLLAEARSGHHGPQARMLIQRLKDEGRSPEPDVD